MWREFLENLLVEGGPIEMASASLYFVAALFLLLSSRGYGRNTGWPGAAILCAGGFRELDFQYRFTSGYVLSTGYFLAGTAPGWELFIVISTLAGLLIVITQFVTLNWSAFVDGLRHGRRFAFLVAGAVGLIFFTTSLDVLQSYLRRNYPSFTDAAFTMWVLEEMLELAIPLLFGAAVLEAAAAKSHRAARLSPRQRAA